MATNQEARLADVRAETGTARTINEDWMALFEGAGLTQGTYNERLLQWINIQLSASFDNLENAMQAFAEDRGFLNWSSMNDLGVII